MRPGALRPSPAAERPRPRPRARYPCPSHPEAQPALSVSPHRGVRGVHGSRSCGPSPPPSWHLWRPLPSTVQGERCPQLLDARQQPPALYTGSIRHLIFNCNGLIDLMLTATNSQGISCIVVLAIKMGSMSVTWGPLCRAATWKIPSRNSNLGNGVESVCTPTKTVILA